MATSCMFLAPFEKTSHHVGPLISSVCATYVALCSLSLAKFTFRACLHGRSQICPQERPGLSRLSCKLIQLTLLEGPFPTALVRYILFQVTAKGNTRFFIMLHDARICPRRRLYPACQPDLHVIIMKRRELAMIIKKGYEFFCSDIQLVSYLPSYLVEQGGSLGLRFAITYIRPSGSCPL